MSYVKNGVEIGINEEREGEGVVEWVEDGNRVAEFCRLIVRFVFLFYEDYEFFG